TNAGPGNLGPHIQLADISSGSNNYIDFNNDGNFLMRIRGDGNVGIGTTDPSYKLDVQGNVNAYQLLINGSEVATTTGANVTSSGSANYIPKFTSDSNIGDSVIYQDGNNVGIGTTSPGSKLNVYDSSSDVQIRVGKSDGTINPTIRWSGDFEGVNNEHADIQLDAENNVFNIFAPNNGAPDIKAISIIESGNVGIGTTSPSAKLHVNGSAVINGTLIGLSNATELTGAVTLSQLQAVNATANIAETDPYWTENSTLVPYLASANTFTNNNIFNTNLTVDGTTFFVNSNTNNVGIGTTSPNAKLEVAGGIRMNTTASKPTCDSSTRGTLWFDQEASGTEDIMYACMRNSGGTYNWAMVARGG
ncbi:hypothetical protein K9L97_03690, partial [Candidatus Woesearchaeota archaeon]|nr:hypothetical protein [Candidatus Woesearchaeota archaeon]